MRRWWVSWYDEREGKYKLTRPWWVSGWAYSAQTKHYTAATICAAVIAPTEAAAKQVIIDAHDDPRPSDLEWRFVEERPADWAPFEERFPREPWMEWP